jgi:hypothetical protein
MSSMGDRKVLIRGAAYDYKEKAPFVVSGKSLLGALELDSYGMAVKCHECGEFFRKVALHSKLAHGMTPKQYKIKHGLRISCGLCSPFAVASLRARFCLTAGSHGIEALIEWHKNNKYVRKNREELLNERNKCMAQLRASVERITKEVGRIPTWIDLRSDGITFSGVKRAHGIIGINALMEAIGLEKPGIRTTSKMPGVSGYYTKVILIELLRDAKVKLGRIPMAKDCRAPLLPALATFVKLFGSWNAALQEAGFGLLAKPVLTQRQGATRGAR